MIELEGLSKRFGSLVAVDHLDLEVRRGELFAVLGPNGAGKTTTFKILVGLQRPSAGRARVGGIDVVADPVGAKRLLGYVPDTPLLYDTLTCRETMRLVAGLWELAPDGLDDHIDELLATFELAEHADRLVGRLSHGMRQKLSFASTFLHQPEVVIVDEPWVGLDPKNIRAIKLYLRAAAARGTTVFLSTHSLSIAEELADRIAILHRGRLRHLGTVDEIKALARESVGGSLEDVFLELTRGDDE
jgi:ABC-2 type transport system ATP-binding protein